MTRSWKGGNAAQFFGLVGHKGSKMTLFPPVSFVGAISKTGIPAGIPRGLLGFRFLAPEAPNRRDILSRTT